MTADSKKALIVIDMQNGFIKAASPLCIRMAEATVPACSRVIREAHRQGLLVAYVTRLYREDGTDVELPRKALWEQGRPITRSARGELSAAYPAEFECLPLDYHIVKPRFSAFFQTSLDLILRRNGIARLYLIGTTTPNCIRTTCYDAISLDYQVTLIEDCCSASTPEIQAANLADLRNIGAAIMSSAAFCAAGEAKGQA